MCLEPAFITLNHNPACGVDLSRRSSQSEVGSAERVAPNAGPLNLFYHFCIVGGPWGSPRDREPRDMKLRLHTDYALRVLLYLDHVRLCPKRLGELAQVDLLGDLAPAAAEVYPSPGHVR